VTYMKIIDTCRDEHALTENPVFNYASVSETDAAELRKHADAIRSGLHHQLESIVAVGERLAKVKEVLPHGNFGLWIDAEFGWKARTAQNYLLAAETYGAKTQYVAYLPVNLLYRLQAPSAPNVRDDLFRMIESGEKPSAEKVETMLLQAREDRRVSLIEAKKTPEERAKEKRRREKAAGDQKRLTDEHKANAQRQLDAAVEAAIIIRSALSDDDIDRLHSLLHTAGLYSLRDALKKLGGAA